MHILEIPSFFPPYGGLFCLDQARALKSRGNEVRILACTQLGWSVDRKTYINASTRRVWKDMDGVEVYQTYTKGVPKATKYNVERWQRVVIRMFEDYVEKHGQPDVIHAQCCKLAGIVAKRISIKYGIPYFITEHLSSVLYTREFGEKWTRTKWLKQLMTEAYEGAKCVITVSDELVENIKPFFGDNYRHSTISNTIDTDFYAYKARETVKNRPYRFCCLAIANVRDKGYDVLIDTLKLFRNSGQNITIDIAGSGTDKAAFKKLFESLDNVTFHGHLQKEGVKELLYQCDALVLPSRSEAQPLVILEAMSTGIPVVSTEVVPNIERIPGACLICKIGNSKDLFQKMIDVQTINPSERISKAVKDICSPDIVARKIEEVVRKHCIIDHDYFI